MVLYWCSVSPALMLITNLTTTGRTARSSKNVLWSKSPRDLFLFLQTWLRIMSHLRPKKKKSLKVLIHSLCMIGPSIVRVSKGRFDAFMGWQFCLLCRYYFTMLPPNNSDCIGLNDEASSTGSKFNQSGIRWDVTSAWLFPIGRW